MKLLIASFIAPLLTPVSCLGYVTFTWEITISGDMANQLTHLVPDNLRVFFT